ncbi:unnamed protein product, partial [marine sediment metagenome]
NIRTLIDNNRINLENNVKDGSEKDRTFLNEWTETQSKTVCDKLEETNKMLVSLQDTVLSTLEKGKTEFDKYSVSFEEKISTILSSHEQDINSIFIFLYWKTHSHFFKLIRSS